MSDTARLRSYLEHIVHSIERIQSYTDELDEAAFVQNEMAQDAVIRNLEVIGEASRNIEKRYPEFAEAHTELPLASAYEMHNASAHGYFKIDVSIVWKTLESDLPDLHAQARSLVESLSKDQ